MSNCEFKYRKPSLRKTAWDYGSIGFYFVTICVRDRVLCFGSVRDGKMILNDRGRIAENCLKALPKHHRSARLDAFVVMPNHVHAIVEIMRHGPGVRPIDNARDIDVEKSQISPLPGSLSVMIRSYKSACTKIIMVARGGDAIADVGALHATPLRPQCEINAPFRWQRGFYDEVVQGNDRLIEIRQYIKDNPANWELEKDRNYGLYY